MNFAAAGGIAPVGLRPPCATPPNGNHVNNRQTIHLSEAKRCSDEAGHLIFYCHRCERGRSDFRRIAPQTGPPSIVRATG